MMSPNPDYVLSPCQTYDRPAGRSDTCTGIDTMAGQKPRIGSLCLGDNFSTEVIRLPNDSTTYSRTCTWIAVQLHFPPHMMATVEKEEFSKRKLWGCVAAAIKPRIRFVASLMDPT